jgi:lipoprotein-anchoring transpeptidase ErfK/SrfK
MAMTRSLRTATLAGAALALVTLALPGKASAQSIFFDWSGGSREVVSISPTLQPGQLIVSFGDRRLYHVTARGKAVSYPIAVPREQSRWAGVTSVSMKRVNPSWTPTPAMRQENPTLPTYVPGGHPRNPLGVRALYLGSSSYRIHGTDAPGTIGQAVSKGCIRMYNEHVLELYDRVNVGTKVTVTWNRYSRG